VFKTLIVEDNVTFRQSLKEVLDAEFPSMDIEEAADGTEALQKVGTFDPHLIFMDIKLPGTNGLELTRKIKGDNANVTIIILTSYDLPEYRAAAAEYGADHFIPKGSSSREELLKLVYSVLPDQSTKSAR
jgi:DNA-binding NarL/FixJ family response regulator